MQGFERYYSDYKYLSEVMQEADEPPKLTPQQYADIMLENIRSYSKTKRQWLKAYSIFEEIIL